MANTWKNQRQKAQKRGPSSFDRQRGPNTGHWENLYVGMKQGALAVYTRAWNSGYDGSGKGTW